MEIATAKLLNLPFDAKEFQPIAIKVTILSNAGKNAPLANLPNDFTFRITHQSSDGSPINKPSNCLFKVEDLNQKIATAQAATQTSLNCYPNPFSNELQVSFYLEQQQAVSLFLYDLQGKLVKIIQSNKIFTEGMHTISVESVTLPKGMYICNLVTRTNQINQKVVLIK